MKRPTLPSPTTFTIELDDRTMEALEEQVIKCRKAPRELLSYVVRDVLAYAQKTGCVLLEPVNSSDLLQ